ncbi:myb-related transcription factor, partner of profilin-like isoform X3 [Ornithodoros turicata]|uniref:myb-related transcription factor, partner of profilin-like isoform X3 n=1 Tax=Ornithodoros turicata TaxID=34597 RepID=UPI003138E6A7
MSTSREMIKDESNSTKSSVLHGTIVGDMTSSYPEKMAEDASLCIKEEPLDTSFSSLPESTEQLATGPTVAASGPICVKTEPYNTTSSVLLSSHRNEDGVAAKDHSAVVAGTQTPAKRVRRPNFTEREIEALVEGYQLHKSAIDATGEGPQGSLAKSKAWQRVTESLFSVSGIRRTTAEVKKKWTDYKSLNKKRGASICRTLSGTGGDAADVPPVTPLEEKVFATMDMRTVAGTDSSYDIGVAGGDIVLNCNDNAQCRGSTSSSSGTSIVLDIVEGLTSSQWASTASSPASLHEPSSQVLPITFAVHEDEAAVPHQQICESAPVVQRTPCRVHLGTASLNGKHSKASEIVDTQQRIEQHLAELIDIQKRMLALKEYKYKVKTLPGGLIVQNKDRD